jgi:LacI family transcriptional regulator
LTNERTRVQWEEQHEEPAVRITTKDISKLANVSRTTVYRALHDQAGINTETKSKVLQIARSLQYHPNRLGMALAKKKTIVIGVITLPQNNPFSGELLKGIESARDELKDFGLSLKVSAMEGLEPARQARMIRALLDDSADGIAIDALDSPEVREAVNDAADADVPVVAYNSDLKGSRRVCFVGQDLFKSGQVAADLLARFVGRRGKIFVLNGFNGFEAHRERLNGFLSVIEAEYPGVEVAAVEEGMDDDFISYDRTLQALKRHPDIQGIYAVAAGIRGLGKALGESGGAGGVRVVCNDLVPETTKLIAEGVIDASIVQDPISQGRLAVKILFDCLFEGRGPLREVYYTDTGIVTKHLL